MSEQQETADGPDTEETAHDDSESGSAGLPDPDDVPQDEIDDIESEREERLDPENRPDNVEVDNTPRTFDPGSGMFTDNPDYDPQDRPFAGEDDEAPEPADPPADREDSSSDDGDSAASD